jgi:hypothetical protein
MENSLASSSGSSAWLNESASSPFPEEDAAGGSRFAAPDGQQPSVSFSASPDRLDLADKRLGTVHEAEAIFDTTLVHTDRNIHYHDVRDLNEAYARSGFSDGAILPHREMVIILDKALRDTERARIEAVREKRYKDSARLSSVQELMREQFRQRQEAQMHHQQDHELRQMEMATKIIKKKFRRDWDQKLSHVEMECETADQLLSQKQLKGRRMLKRRIRNLPKPKNRMSKQMVALVQSEKHMAKNHQYRDAAELNKRIQKQLPVEKARFRRVYEKRIENIRVQHGKNEEFDVDLLFEKNKLNKLSVRDEKVLAERELRLKLANHELALRHALQNELNEPAGWMRTVKPIVARRKNHHKTSSIHRGTQVLASVSHARLEAPSLCDMHDFNTDHGMSTLSWAEFEESKRLGYTQPKAKRK